MSQWQDATASSDAEIGGGWFIEEPEESTLVMLDAQ